ncbi:MAG: UvrD-helicase domain-containing protein [Clostridia bacterium]|nr:UvrD-helicase domain-containing protein [Clostridia bacterium]
MGFTKEQIAAIESTGKTLVSASAGSGKTTVMIEKIIRFIKAGGNVSEILAVTFTKKAAAQMKEKLSKALIEAINESDVTPERRAFLKKQLAEVPMADISTIHAFCAKLLRTHFFAAGVDNNFRIIGSDDAEGTVLQNEALDELLEEGYESGDEEFSHLLSVYWRKNNDYTLRKIFVSTYDDIRSRADYREYLAKSGDYDEQTFEEICKDLKKKLDEKCRYYRELVEDERAYFSDVEKSPQRAICDETMGYLEEMIAAPDYFSALRVEKPAFSKNTAKKLDEEKAFHANRIKFLKERVVDSVESEQKGIGSKAEELEKFLTSARTAKALASYLLRFDEKYGRLKAERGVLDYNDLEHKALALLQGEEVRNEIRGKYAYVFVDEYQDVNPVQEAIVSAVSGENLFLVGDVKQAIYGFRGSKSKFFVEKQAQFENGEGENLYMSRNFRSSDKVLDAVNKQFTLAMTPRVCDVDYARGSVMERGGRYELNDGRVCVHFLPKEEKKAAERRGVYSVRSEAMLGENGSEDGESASAKLIRAVVEKELKSKYYDPDKGEYRNVQYSDIAVLSRKKKGLIEKTVEALSESIPVTAASAVNICEFSEIKTLMDLLSLVDNAEQDVPLCSALLSAVGNCNADDLASVRLAYPKEYAFRNACKKYAAEKSDETAEKLRKFYAYFEELRTLSRVLDAGELLLRVLSDTRMEADLLTRINGVAALKRIHRFIEEATTPEPLCVHEFLERLRDLNYEIDYSENGGENSVKVLTMHSSKGLEYPIVILDNLSESFTRRGAPDEVYVEEKYGLAPFAFNGERMIKSGTVLRRLHERREGESSRSDSLNLYYVALTRAKYGLHMIFKDRTLMADVKYAQSFADFTDFSAWQAYIVDDDAFEVPVQERDSLVFRPDETLARKIMGAFTWQYPFHGYENLPVKSSATQLLTPLAMEPQDTLQLFDEGESYETKGETSKEVGIAYHAFLENFDFDLLYREDGEKRSREELGALVEEMRNEGGMVEMKLLSSDKLVDILSNSAFARLRGKRLYKEQQFLVSLPVRDTYAKREDADPILAQGEEEMIYQGAIDLLAIGEDGETQIIDYKFSKGSAAYLRAHYRPQLELYRQAAAKILRIPPEKIRCSIINIYHGFEVDI